MDIIILLCILLILMFLGGSFFQDGKMYLGGIMKNTVTTIIINDLTKNPLQLIEIITNRNLYLLNIITTSNTQKGAKTTLSSTKILTFAG